MGAFAVKVEINATVDGQKLDVSAATLTLAINSIPAIELSCAPSEPKGGSSPSSPNVFKPTVSDFSKLYAKLSKSADGLSKTGSVTITVKDSIDREDSISLDGWVISGVGMSSIGATAAPYLTVILQHPICKLTKVGSIYETTKTMLSTNINGAVKGKTKLTEIMDAVYKYVSNANDAFCPASKTAVQYRSALSDPNYLPSTYLHDETGVFLGSTLGDLTQRMVEAEADIVLPREGGGSVWDALMGACGDMLVDIVQDQTYNYTQKQLLLAPKEPWASPSVVLDEEDCCSTEVPGMDSCKISGVMARKPDVLDGLLQGLSSHELGNLDKIKEGVGEVLYVPEGVSPKISDGRIMKIGIPNLLATACSKDAPKSGGNAELKGFTCDGASVYSNAYEEPLKAYCKAVYECCVKATCLARAQMVLGFRENHGAGHLILPGNTCRFVSGGDTIYHGYIQQVVHVMSTGGGCSTVISMTHARHDESYKVGDVTAVSSGAKNPAYDQEQ